LKLTNSMRDIILSNILKDMPDKIDYKEQIQQIVWNDSFSQLPIDLRSAIAANKDIKNYLEVKSSYIADFRCMYLRSYNHYIQSKDAVDKITKLHLLNDEQGKKFDEIRNNLKAIIYACDTDKQLADNYPEFASYLPKENQPIRNLPAADLINTMKQAGWQSVKQEV